MPTTPPSTADLIVRNLRALPRSARVQVIPDVAVGGWLVNTNGAAAVLKVRVDYLRKLRTETKRTGPGYVRVGPKLVWYRLDDLIEFLPAWERVELSP